MTKEIKNLWRPLFGVALILAILSSCKKKENPYIGIEVQPDNTALGLFTTDTFLLTCTTLKMDSTLSDNAATGVVGSYQDPIFGLVKTSTIFQYRLASDNIDIENLKTYRIDSAVLSLAYSGYYGTLENQTFKVYEVQEDLTTDKRYATNYKVSKSTNPVGKLENFKPNLSDIPVIDGTPEVPEIRILLDSSFAMKLVSVNSSAYNSIGDFLQEFRGFVVKAENPGQKENTGAQLLFDMLSDYTRLTLYYTQTDGSKGKSDYPINESSVRFNKTENDYSGSPVESAFNSPVVGKNNIYVQSLAGTQVKIETPDISRLFEKGKVILNKAEFQFPIASGSLSQYPAIPQLFMFRINDDGVIADTPDKGELHYDGKLGTSDYTYRFGLTRYFQQVLNGKLSNNGLILRERGEEFGRVELSGPEASSRPMKLVVTYTPLY